VVLCSQSSLADWPHLLFSYSFSVEFVHQSYLFYDLQPVVHHCLWEIAFVTILSSGKINILAHSLPQSCG